MKVADSFVRDTTCNVRAGSPITQITSSDRQGWRIITMVITTSPVDNTGLHRVSDPAFSFCVGVPWTAFC